MRTLPTFFALCAISSGLAAQTTYQAWNMYPGATSLTTRGNIGVGSLYQGVHALTNRGVLEVARKSAIARFGAVIQDQNCASREKFGFVARFGIDAIGPFPGKGTVLGRVAGLQLPGGPPLPPAHSSSTPRTGTTESNWTRSRPGPATASPCTLRTARVPTLVTTATTVSTTKRGRSSARPLSRRIP